MLFLILKKVLKDNRLNLDAILYDITSANNRINYFLHNQNIDNTSKNLIMNLQKELDSLKNEIVNRKANSYNSNNQEYNRDKASLEVLTNEIIEYYNSVLNINNLEQNKIKVIDDKVKKYRDELNKYSKLFGDQYEKNNKQYYGYLSEQIIKANKLVDKIEKCKNIANHKDVNQFYYLVNSKIDKINNKIYYLGLKLNNKEEPTSTYLLFE